MEGILPTLAAMFSRCESSVGLFITARRALLTWEMVSERILTEQIKSALRSITIVQVNAPKKIFYIVEKDTFSMSNCIQFRIGLWWWWVHKDRMPKLARTTSCLDTLTHCWRTEITIRSAGFQLADIVRTIIFTTLRPAVDLRTAFWMCVTRQEMI